MPISAEHRAKMLAGRAAYLQRLREQKGNKDSSRTKTAMNQAIRAQGGEVAKGGRKPQVLPEGLPPYTPPPLVDPNFELMALQELREWVTHARRLWDEAIRVLQKKEAQWGTDNNSVPCACGCGTKIDLSRGRFASSESYWDENRMIKTRYWATQRCVQAYRLAQSPEYKHQMEKEMEEKIQAKLTNLPTTAKVLEG